MSDKRLEALKLADAALSGANMNMTVVMRKIREALAEHPAQGEVVGWLYRGGGPRPVSEADEWKYWHGPDRPVLSWDHQEIKPVYTAPSAPAVPEGLRAKLRSLALDLRRMVERHPEHCGYITDRDQAMDWIAAEMAVLAAAPEVKP